MPEVYSNLRRCDMKVLVTGSRKWTNKTLIHDLLETIKPDLVIFGDATGADKIAKEYCEAYDVPYKEFEADWDKFGSWAGPLRNQDMIDEKPDMTLAFLKIGEKNKGTLDCIGRALFRKIPVVITQG